jgi:hypothetical protein
VPIALCGSAEPQKVTRIQRVERVWRSPRWERNTCTMSILTERSTAVVPAGDGTTPDTSAPSPTVTHYQQLTGEFLKKLDDLASTVPQLELSHPSTADFVRTHLNVPMQFLSTVVSLVEQFPDLQAVGRMDLKVARDDLQYIDAWRSAIDKLATFTDAMQFSVASRQAKLTDVCFQVWSITKSLARDPGSPHMANAVELMRKDFRRPPKPKKTDGTSAPPPIVTTKVQQ